MTVASSIHNNRLGKHFRMQQHHITIHFCSQFTFFLYLVYFFIKDNYLIVYQMFLNSIIQYGSMKYKGNNTAKAEM